MKSLDPAAPDDDVRPPALGPAAERLVVGGGLLAIAGAAVAAVVLNVVYGEAAFAARLLAGIAGCL